MAYSVTEVAKMTVKEMGKDDASGLAAELSYRFFLTLFPFFIFLGALGGIIARAFSVENPADRLMNQLGNELPSDAASILHDQIQGIIESSNGAILSVGILGAIWSASGAIGTIMKALNRAYDVEETRSLWKRYLLAIGITVLAGTAMIVSVTLVILGQFMSNHIADWLGVSDAVGTAIAWLRWPILIVLMMCVAAFLYWIAPNAKLPFKFISPGAISFVVAWLIATAAFGAYVANFGSYNATYGALGGVVVLLLWFYLSSLVFLAGAELNAVLDTLAAREGERDRSRQRSETRRVEQPRDSRVTAAARRPGFVTAILGTMVAGITLIRLVHPARRKQDREKRKESGRWHGLVKV